ncbi:MAG: CDP-glucose 4,6-dehydratase [Clostridium sp.]|nr:CDP-glucose 4,6-dehydratase [Clostridium sp.]
MGERIMELSFYNRKKVLVTGHTGFKGSWMCRALVNAGADVVGYALEPPTQPNLFEISGLSDKMTSVIGDVRDYAALSRVFTEHQPEIVIHMAAQPIVRESYRDPRGTYETNVMGTVNVLECIRLTDSVRSFVNVTTDKVYRNREWCWGYRENEELNGYDPYSNSKSCSELVTGSYVRSFFAGREIAVTTARAGNVIGGGDFAVDRIIPDCIRAALRGEDIVVRNPHSTRPYQHVLEPVMAYLMMAARQYEKLELAGCYNVGPDDENCMTTGELVTLFCRCWNERSGKSSAGEDNLTKGSVENGGEHYEVPTREIKWIDRNDGGPHEANFLKLDCTKLKNIFGWRPRWNMETAINKILEWTDCYTAGKDVGACMDKQIEEYLSCVREV